MTYLDVDILIIGATLAHVLSRSVSRLELFAINSKTIDRVHTSRWHMVYNLCVLTFLFDNLGGLKFLFDNLGVLMFLV